MDNLGVNRLQIVINKVLAAFIGKRQSESLPAPWWKWVSMECQPLLAFHYGELPQAVAIFVYIRGINCFGTLQGSQILSSSGVNNMGCYCPGRCGGNIPHRSAHNGCHILVYGYFWSSATHITDDARPKIIDALLTLIFMMGQGAFHCLFCL
jgi:hypothetical protein